MRRSSPFSLVSVVTLCLASHRDVDFPQLTGLYPLKGVADGFRLPRYARPCGVHQDDYGHSPIGQVLLVSDALIGGDQDLVSRLPQPGPARPRWTRCPSHVLAGHFDLVAEELAAQLPGRPLIEQDVAWASLGPEVLRHVLQQPPSPPIPRLRSNQSMKSYIVAPSARFSKRVYSGKRVPVNTQLPLTLPGTLSTAGHLLQSVILSPPLPLPNLLLTRRCRKGLRAGRRPAAHSPLSGPGRRPRRATGAPPCARPACLSPRRQ